MLQTRVAHQVEQGAKLVEFVPESMLIMGIIKEATPCLGAGLESSLINGSRREIEQIEGHNCKLAKALNACGDGLVNLETAFVELSKRFQDKCQNDRFYALNVQADFSQEMVQIEDWQGILKQRQDALLKQTNQFEEEKRNFQHIKKLQDEMSGGFAVEDKVKLLKEKEIEINDCTEEEVALQQTCTKAEADMVRLTRSNLQAQQEVAGLHETCEKERKFVEDKYETWQQREQETNAQRIELANIRKGAADKNLQTRQEIGEEEEKAHAHVGAAKATALLRLNGMKMQVLGGDKAVSGCHIILTLDKSYSMSGGSPKSKWHALTEAIRVFGATPRYQDPDQCQHIVSLITFNSSAYTLCEAVPLGSFDPDLLKGETPYYGTNFESAFDKVKQVALSNDRSKQVVVLLLTDGDSSDGDKKKAGKLASQLHEALGKQLFTFVLPFISEGETPFPELFMKEVIQGGNGNRDSLKLPDGKTVNFFMPANINNVVECFSTIRQCSFEVVEKMIKATEEFWDSQAKLYAGLAQEKVSNMDRKNLSLMSSLDTEFEPLITGRAKLAADAKTEWQSAIKECAEKNLENQLTLKQGQLDKSDAELCEAEQNLAHLSDKLKNHLLTSDGKKESLFDQIKKLRKKISDMETKEFENGSIKDPLNKAMLRALFSQLDDQNRKAEVIYDSFVLAFQSVMGWLRTLASELKKPAIKQLSDRQVRGVLESHYVNKGSDIKDGDGLYDIVEEMIMSTMRPRQPGMEKKGKKAPPSVAKVPESELRQCARDIAHIFPFPERYVSSIGEQVDGQDERDSNMPAMSPHDKHFQAMISKLEKSYLSSGGHSSVGQTLDDLKAKLEEQKTEVRKHKKIKPFEREAGWDEELTTKQNNVEDVQKDINEAEKDRTDALKDLSSTKLTLERLVISWTDIVEQAHQEKELYEFKTRLLKFESIFKLYVRPWVEFLERLHSASLRKPNSCLRFDMPELTFRGEQPQLVLTNKNLKRIFNILDVPPAERESKVRAGTSDVSSVTADADDSTADDSASQS